MTALDVDAVRKFHISLNVRNLAAAVEFYRVLFHREPAKRYPEYAKFEIEEPPVIFSLSPQVVGCGGPMSNIGLQVAGEETLGEMERRLTAVGIASRMQTDALCGNVRQVKLWVTDPDGNHWELYVPGEDVDPAVVQRGVEGAAPRCEQSAVKVWDHHISHGCPARIPHADDSLDEVRLQGAFNADYRAEKRERLLQEAFRVLRAGGRVEVHGLAADRPFPNGPPSLPGLAALVAQVPLERAPATALLEVGFVGLQVTKFSPAPVFMHDGVEMREQKLLAWKPAAIPEEVTRQVLYKGPFAEATDDEGRVFVRGRRVSVVVSARNRLRDSAAADQFLFLNPHG